MKRSILYKILFSILAIVLVERFCHNKTAGFRLGKASTSYNYHFPKTATTPPPSLYQTFTFLGVGVQSYAFLGEDGKTVLKLFKHRHVGLPTNTLAKLPLNLGSSTLKKRKQRMLRLFESVQIASSTLPKETGILFTHLAKSENLGTITLYDKIGVRHSLNLDKTEFVLQKWIEPAGDTLHRLFKEGKKEEALEAMNLLVSLISSCSEKGVKNRDGKITENYGFLDNVPLALDIGSNHIRENSTNPDPHKKAALRARLQLLTWVKKNYPENLPLCKKELLHESIY